MTSEGRFQLTRLQVPDFDSLVPTPTHQSLTIWADGDGKNRVGMTSEDRFQLTRLQVPEFDSLVTTPTHQSRFLRT